MNIAQTGIIYELVGRRDECSYILKEIEKGRISSIDDLKKYLGNQSFCLDETIKRAAIDGEAFFYRNCVVLKESLVKIPALKKY